MSSVGRRVESFIFGSRADLVVQNLELVIRRSFGASNYQDFPGAIGFLVTDNRSNVHHNPIPIVKASFAAPSCVWMSSWHTEMGCAV